MEFMLNLYYYIQQFSINTIVDERKISIIRDLNKIRRNKLFSENAKRKISNGNLNKICKICRE